MTEAELSRELGVLKQRQEDMEKAYARQLAELNQRFAQFLEEERSEHKMINDNLDARGREIAALDKKLDIHLETTRHARRNLAAVAGTIGAGVVALALKLWDAWHKQ